MMHESPTRRLTNGPSLNPQLSTPIRVIVLGFGDSGKTSLVDRLVNNRFEERRASTEGINLFENSGINFSSPGKGQNFVFNFWDCAGQSLTYGLHRLFLGSRAIYLIAGSGPEGEDSLFHWHDVVSSYGGSKSTSPIIMLATQCDRADKQFEVRSSQWARALPLFRQALRVDSKSGTGIENLKELLTLVAQELSVDTQVTKNESEILGVLKGELKLKNKIPFSEFAEICRRSGINQLEGQTVLAKKAQDSGMATLIELDGMQLFLEPAWACNGLYSLIRTVRKNDGKIDPVEFVNPPEVLVPYKEHLPLLLNILRQNNLAFQQEGLWIVPNSILTEASPEVYQFDEILEQVAHSDKGNLGEKAKKIEEATIIELEFPNNRFLGREILGKLMAIRHTEIEPGCFLNYSTVLRNGQALVYVETPSMKHKISIVGIGPENERCSLISQTMEDIAKITKRDFPISEQKARIFTDYGWCDVEKLINLRDSGLDWQAFSGGSSVMRDPEIYLRKLGL